MVEDQIIHWKDKHDFNLLVIASECMGGASVGEGRAAAKLNSWYGDAFHELHRLDKIAVAFSVSTESHVVM